MRWEKTFELSAPVERVWRAFVDPDEFKRWNVDPDDAYQAGGAVEIDITEVRRHERIAWEEREGDRRVAMSVAFTETETGTRITLTRSGFGEGDEWGIVNESRLSGWREALHDLAAYLATGVVLRRHFEGRSATGVVVAEDAGGLHVLDVRPGTFGEEAGLEPGDVIVRLGGAAVFARSDLWFAQRLFEPGTEVTVDAIREGRVRSSSAPMSPMDEWADPGELGGATYPRAGEPATEGA